MKRIKTLSFLILLFSITVLGSWDGSQMPDLYNSAWVAQNSGSYEEWLTDLPGKRGIKKDVRDLIKNELEEIKRMPPDSREKELENFLRYYSEAHRQYLPGAVGFEKHAGYSWNDLVRGRYDSEELANNLVRRSRKFDEQVLEPLLSQVERSLRTDFPERNIFCLGRDFTVGYLYMKWRGKIPKDKLFTLNVSRKIKDLVEAGKTTELRELVYSLGLTKEKLIRDGIVFIDSSKAGKIPRAMLKAFVEDMSDREATQLLKRTDVQYVKSSTGPGIDLRSRVKEKLAAEGATLSRRTINRIIAEQWSIPEFSLKLPSALKDHPKGKNHHLFEHRPKFIRTADRFSRHGRNEFLFSPPPTRPSDKITSMLGLYADLKFLEDVVGDKPEPKRKVKNEEPREVKVKEERPREEKKAHEKHRRKKLEIEPWLHAKFQEIEQAAAGGFHALANWQNQGEHLANAEIGQMNLKRTNDEHFPYRLETPHGKFRLSTPIGEGNNVKVYLTDEGTVLKVMKDWSRARKSFLTAWASPLLEKAGIATAKPLWLPPSGLLLEQEYIPSDALEVNYGQGQRLPKEIKNQILDHWEKLRKIAKSKGLYFDPKAGNYHERDGEIVFVDYTPRLNSTYWQYYTESAQGRTLSEEAFLDRFLHHEINRGRGQKAVYKKCKEILKYAKGE